MLGLSSQHLRTGMPFIIDGAGWARATEAHTIEDSPACGDTVAPLSFDEMLLDRRKMQQLQSMCETEAVAEVAKGRPEVQEALLRRFPRSSAVGAAILRNTKRLELARWVLSVHPDRLHIAPAVLDNSHFRRIDRLSAGDLIGATSSQVVHRALQSRYPKDKHIACCLALVSNENGLHEILLENFPRDADVAAGIAQTTRDAGLALRLLNIHPKHMLLARNIARRNRNAEIHNCLLELHKHDEDVVQSVIKTASDAATQIRVLDLVPVRNSLRNADSALRAKALAARAVDSSVRRKLLVEIRSDQPGGDTAVAAEIVKHTDDLGVLRTVFESYPELDADIAVRTHDEALLGELLTRHQHRPYDRNVQTADELLATLLANFKHAAVRRTVGKQIALHPDQTQRDALIEKYCPSDKTVALSVSRYIGSPGNTAARKKLRVFEVLTKLHQKSMPAVQRDFGAVSSPTS